MACPGLLGRSNIVWHCAAAGASPSSSAPFRCLQEGGASWWGIKATSPPGLGSRRLCLSLENAFSGAPHHALHQLSPLSKRQADKRQCVRLIPPPGKAPISLLSAPPFSEGLLLSVLFWEVSCRLSPHSCCGFPGPALGPGWADACFLTGGVASSWVAGNLWEGRALHRTDSA